jgi:hypothetical protein
MRLIGLPVGLGSRWLAIFRPLSDAIALAMRAHRESAERGGGVIFQRHEAWQGWPFGPVRTPVKEKKKNSVTPKDIPNANMACDYMWLWLLYNISIYSVALWNDIPKIYHCGSFSSHGAMGLLDPMGSTGTPRATPCLPSAFARGKFLPGCCRKCPDIHTGQILGMYVDHLAII